VGTSTVHLCTILKAMEAAPAGDQGANTSADELLKQMVGHKGGEGDAAPSAEKDKAEEKAPASTMLIESDSDNEKAKPAAAPAPPKPPAPPAPPAPPKPPGAEKEKTKKDKKEKKKKAKSSSSSDSDSDDSDAPKKKRRINNFSSLRNIEKERADVRKHRNAGAEAASAMLKALSDNPYFAP
ncbi:unnamed protein product, partial [Effrenium voratum]